RMLHVINHVNPRFNKAWKDLSEAIVGFGIQNEAQSYSSVGDPSWVCNRAKVIKGLLSKGINVFTGGGQNVSSSVLPQHIACSEIDVISIHSYDVVEWTDPANYGTLLNSVTAAGKRAVIEELGATGSNRAASLDLQLAAINRYWTVPFMPWAVQKPGSSVEHEFWTDNKDVWSVFSTAAAIALSSPGVFVWTEVANGSVLVSKPSLGHRRWTIQSSWTQLDAKNFVLSFFALFIAFVSVLQESF
ncbi:hypothetical protein HDU93_002560, partial [Gonapodya sp. JEL0774]